MTYNELNEYILNYLENDKTNSAIMLTGAWGTGKSYYIENTLKPYIKDHKKDCIIISLYGLSELSEISKSLYIEAKLKKHLNFYNKLKSKIKNSEEGVILAKTIMKGATSYFGIDLTLSEKSIQKLYDSVDFKNRLIVLEDVERTSIDIIELLGYVNSLVEQDNVKVLLVCNEQEIIETKDENNRSKNLRNPEEIRAQFDIVYYYVKERRNERKTDRKNSIEYSDITNRYLKAKEKTVSDTIVFENDLNNTIFTVIDKFNNEILSGFSNQDVIDQLLSQYIKEKFNLRTFIFACQKTVNIFDYLKTNNITDEDFYKNIFFSIVYFSFYVKTAGNIPEWSGDEYCSSVFSSSYYPLYYFCYLYIKNQTMVAENIDNIVKHFTKNKLLFSGVEYHNNDISILEYYSLYSKDTVLNSLDSLIETLHNSTVPFSYYGKIIKAVVHFHELFDYDYTEIKELMKNWVSKHAEDIDLNYKFGIIDDVFDENALNEECKAFLTELKNVILDNSKKDCIDFDYNPDSINVFSNEISNKENLFADGKGFLSKLDNDKLFNMMKECNARQLYELYSIFLRVYRHGERELYGFDDIELKRRYSIDLESLKILVIKIDEYASSYSGDEIIGEWYIRICDNLNRVISVLQSEE
ncbi:MAG: hypothetical protein IJR70_04745 [Eubacterium sp.]|nr:hypothetical protein [Eubacterium sp.]